MADEDVSADDESPLDGTPTDETDVTSDEEPADEPAAGSEPASSNGERQPESDDGRDCPECDESLPAGARFCPHCSTAIDEHGEVVDLSELEGDLLPDDPSELLTEDEAGLRRASGSVRAIAGLAVSVPLAPLTLFLVGTVVPLSVWSAALVFLAGWFGPAAVLSRARVPAEAFGYSLYLIAAGTLLLPVAIEAGGEQSWADTLSVTFDTVAAVSLVIAAVLIVLGTFVTGQARKRVTGERRGFEEYREEDGSAAGEADGPVDSQADDAENG